MRAALAALSIVVAAACGQAEAPPAGATADAGTSASDATPATEAPDAAPADQDATPTATDAAPADQDAALADAGPADQGPTTGEDALPRYFPPLTGDTWAIDATGWDPAALAEAETFAADNRSTALLVVQHGRIVSERYWAGGGVHATEIIASAAKSVTAVLIGLMLDDGTIALDDTVTAHLGAGWSTAPAAQEAAITVRHLLTMTSGLDDQLAFSAAPGTQWYYNTNAYYALGDVIDASSGATRDDFTARRLFDRIGARDSRWRTRSLLMSARDMARFGLLVLADGAWDGAPVLRDTAYLRDATRPSQAHNPSYGYLWWLNGQSGFRLPGDAPALHAGALIPTAPADLVAALGAGDKKIYVVPSRDLVVVRLGDATGAPQLALSSFDAVLWEKLTAAMPPR